MLNKDFDMQYIIHFEGVCPSGESYKKKKIQCAKDFENGYSKISSTCKKCWRSYIEQQEPGDGWISVNDRLPERPGLKTYEHVECLIVLNGEVIKALWNCEHLVWDDRSGDDYLCDPKTPTHWRPLPKLPEGCKGKCVCQECRLYYCCTLDCCDEIGPCDYWEARK